MHNREMENRLKAEKREKANGEQDERVVYVKERVVLAVIQSDGSVELQEDAC